jgi:hypothetical protein
VGVFPTLLLTLALVHSERETVLGMNGLTFGALIALAGIAAYYASTPLRRLRRLGDLEEDPDKTSAIL